MAVLVTVPSQQYTPRTVSVTPTFPAGASRARVTLTGPSAAWPAGIDYLDPDSGQIIANAVFRLRIVRPDGSPGGAAVLLGGTYVGKGSPLTRFLDCVLQGSGAPLASSWGPYSVTAQVLVTLTAAILVERF